MLHRVECGYIVATCKVNDATYALKLGHWVLLTGSVETVAVCAGRVDSDPPFQVGTTITLLYTPVRLVVEGEKGA